MELRNKASGPVEEQEAASVIKMFYGVFLPKRLGSVFGRRWARPGRIKLQFSCTLKLVSAGRRFNFCCRKIPLQLQASAGFLEPIQSGELVVSNEAMH